MNMNELVEFFENKLVKPIVNEKIINMGNEIIGKEITLEKEYPYNKITVLSINGLKIIKNCKFIELIGVTQINKKISMLMSIPTFKKLYKHSISINENTNDIYIKDISE